MSSFKEMKGQILSGDYPIWFSSDAVDEMTMNSMPDNLDITVFNYTIDVNDTSVLDDALSTIREHHPNEDIWVQYQSKI